MRPPRIVTAVALGLGALALGFAACGGDDDEEATTSPAPAQAPSGGGAPQSTGALPEQLVECFADKGFELTSPTEIHSAPPQVVQECFGALHQGGAVP